jgi:protein tyrosine phosphatase
MIKDGPAERRRYEIIVPYKKTRVKLVKGAEENLSLEFINACYVNSPVGKKKLIATQGPTPETTDHFW